MFVDEVVSLPAPAAARDRLLALMRVDAGWQDAASGAFDEGRKLLLLAGVAGATETCHRAELAAVSAGRHDRDPAPVGDGGAGG